MCVIIVKDNKKVLPKNVLATSSVINPHGLGVFWLDTLELETYRSDEWDVLHINRPFIAHFRYATVGEVCPANCHPFEIDDKHLLFQNGSVYSMGNKDMTDTEHMAQTLAACDPIVWQDILEMTDCRWTIVNRVTGEYHNYNIKMWHKKHGALFSKNNVLGKHIMAVYGTLRHGFGNHRLLTTATEIGDGHTEKPFRMVANGIPYVSAEQGEKGGNIAVEVYAVNDTQLERIDQLEGHPNWYRRKKTPITLNNGATVDAWLYFNETVNYPQDALITDFTDHKDPDFLHKASGYYGSAKYVDNYADEFFHDSILVDKGDPCPYCRTPLDDIYGTAACHTCGVTFDYGDDVTSNVDTTELPKGLFDEDEWFVWSDDSGIDWNRCYSYSQLRDLGITWDIFTDCYVSMEEASEEYKDKDTPKPSSNDDEWYMNMETAISIRKSQMNADELKQIGTTFRPEGDLYDDFQLLEGVTTGKTYYYKELKNLDTTDWVVLKYYKPVVTA